jgi:hypothetical protein
MKNLYLLFCILCLSSCSSENQFDENGFKHGKWTEYLTYNENIDCSAFSYILNREITNIDSIRNNEFTSKREVIYEHGYPKGVVKEFIDVSKQSIVLYEFNLKSGPYSKNLSRPIDIYTGIYKTIRHGKLFDWTFFDDQGKEDIYKKLSKGFNDAEIQNDSRLQNIDFYKDSIISDDLELFKKYDNNKELLLQNINNARKIINNKNLWRKTTGGCPGNAEFDLYNILSIGLKNKNFIINAINNSNNVVQKKEIPLCTWCGKPNYRYSPGTYQWEHCSDKCWNERRASGKLGSF